MEKTTAFVLEMARGLRGGQEEQPGQLEDNYFQSRRLADVPGLTSQPKVLVDVAPEQPLSCGRFALLALLRHDLAKGEGEVGGGWTWELRRSRARGFRRFVVDSNRVRGRGLLLNLAREKLAPGLTGSLEGQGSDASISMCSAPGHLQNRKLLSKVCAKDESIT